MAFNKNKWEKKYADALASVRKTEEASSYSTSGKGTAAKSESSFNKENWERKYADSLAAIRGTKTSSSTANAGVNGALPNNVLASNNPAYLYAKTYGNGKTGAAANKPVKGTATPRSRFEPADTERPRGRASAQRAFTSTPTGNFKGEAVVKSALSSSAAAYKKLVADATSSSGNLSMGESARTAIDEVKTAKKEGRQAKLGQAQRKAEQKKAESFNDGWMGDFKQKLLAGAEESSERAYEYEQEAKEGLGKFGQGVVDFGIAGAQFAGDALLNAVAPGSGLAAMAGRAYGSASLEAQQRGLSEGEQQISGIKSAAIEMLTEKLFGSVSKVAYGKGIIKNENLVNNLVNRLAKTDKGRTALKVLVGANEEGMEEVLSDILNPVADRILKLDDGKGDWSDLTDDFNTQQMLEDYIIGGALGLVGAGTNVVSGQYRAENAQQRAYEEYQRQLVNAGLATEQGSDAQLTAEKYKNILDQSTQRGKRNLSDKETENLESLIRGTYAQEDASDVSSRLAQLGTDADEQTVNAIVKAVNGETLNRAEQKAFDANPYSQRVVNEMLDTEGVTSNEWYADRASAQSFTPESSNGISVERAQNVLNTSTASNPVFVNSMARQYDVAPEVVERTYNLNPTAPQAFETAFNAVYQMGQQGTDKAALSKVPVLNTAQANIAYQMGADSVNAASVSTDVNTDTAAPTQTAAPVDINNTQEVNENGVRIHNVAERIDGQNTEGQIRGVEAVAGENVGGRSQQEQGGAGEVQIKAGEKVSYKGKQQKGVYYAAEDTEDMKKGRELAESYGYKVRYFVGGNIRYAGGEFRGVVDTANKTVMVRADHPDYTAEQIMRHEMGHAAFENGDLSIDEAREMLLDNFTADELNELIEIYSSEYGGILSPEEAFEEICCDALGRMNIFEGTDLSSESYEKAQDTVRKYAAEKNNSKGRAPPKKGGVKYSWGRDFSLSTVNNNAISLLTMKPVAKLTGNEFAKSDTSLMERVTAFFAGKEMLNPELGRVEFTKSSFRDNRGHGLTKLKVVSYAAVPNVIQNGKVIDYKPDYEGRPYDRITIAAPITIGDESYFTGVMVQRDQNTQRFYIHDVITEKEARTPFTTGLSAKNGEDTRGAQRLYITNIIRNALQVKQNAGGAEKYSLEPVKPIQPKNGEWERGSTTDEVRAKRPDLWAVDAESSESRNPTQISGTVKSYRKIYDALKAEGFDGTVLDASSGLGYGTRAGIEEYGFNVEDIEPFPDNSYKPKYTDYSKLHKKYDVIISNAVLNVLPQDQRDALVVKMGQMLNDGGRMFINVRGTDVRNASSKVPIDEANMEYYISNTGSYQKGFTKKELVAYLSDALGEGYTVVGTNKFGAVSAVVTKQAEASKKFSREPERLNELRRQNERKLAQATAEDAANENERGLIRDYQKQYSKVEDIREKLSAAQQTLTEAENNGADYDTTTKAKNRFTLLSKQYAREHRKLNGYGSTKALQNVLERVSARTAKDAGHIDNRSFSSVGDRGVKPFQMEHPELHKYYEDMAQTVLDDIGTATMYRTKNGYVKTKFTDDFKRALGGSSFNDGLQALEDIANDHGSENYALAKRMELFLDDLLTNGYKGASGNAEYIRAKENISGGNTAWENYLEENSLAIADGLITENELYQEFIQMRSDLPEGMGAASANFTGEETVGERWVTEAQGKGDSALHPISKEQEANLAEQQQRAPQEIPKKDLNGKLTSKHVSTIANSGMTPAEFSDALREDAALGKFSHIAYSDEAALKKANRTIEINGWDQALADYKAEINSGRVSKDNTVMGIALYNNAVNSGDYATAMDIASLMVKNSTNTAQSLQAMRILNKLSPECKLYLAAKSVENIEEDLNERYKDNKADIHVDKILYDEYAKALRQGDEDGIKTAWANIEQSVAQQIDATWYEKLNNFRYLAMLGNPRTHVRNIVGNAFFVPVRAVKNTIAYGLENIANAKINGGIERSKAILNPSNAADAALIKYAMSDFEAVQEVILSGGKYVDTFQGIDKSRTIYKTKILEAARKGNLAALDAEDAWFCKPAYANALAKWYKANGISAEQLNTGKVPEETIIKAQTIAIKEAQKATYRDTNWFSAQVSRLGKVDNKIASVLIEGVLPFKKTPANILARAVEYSPVGLIKSLALDTKKVKAYVNGDIENGMSPAQFIDDVSAGLTGTALMGLGVLLASWGVLSGGEGDDDKQNYFDDLSGKQNYALSIGGLSITLDWLAPESMPLFVGVEFFNSLSSKNEDNSFVQNLISSIMSLSTPMFEMSMLQSVNDLFDNLAYIQQGEGTFKIVSSMASNYISQYFPTLFGQAERTFEETQRETTYIDRNSAMGSELQYMWGKIANKIPFYDFSQIPYIDAWGRTEETGNLFERMLNNFVNPAYVKQERPTEIDGELERLYDLGETGVYPSRAETDTKINGEYLTADEYVKYATAKGQTSYELAQGVINSAAYSGASDPEKAYMLKYVYSYADHIARYEVNSDYSLAKWEMAAYKSGNPMQAIIDHAQEYYKPDEEN